MKKKKQPIIWLLWVFLFGTLIFLICASLKSEEDLSFSNSLGSLIGALMLACFWGFIVLGPLYFGAEITQKKGRGQAVGFFLGLLLSWLGVLIAACLSNEKSNQIKAEEDAQFQNAQLAQMAQQNELLAQIASGKSVANPAQQSSYASSLVYLVADNGEEVGRFNHEQIRVMLRNGSLSSDSYFLDGANEWKPILQIALA